MRATSNKNFWLLIFVLLASLLPYFIICFHALPFADDFCFGWLAAENTSFLQKFLDQYLKWNGRYSADILVHLHPLVSGKLALYQLTLFLSLLAIPVVLYSLTKSLIENKRVTIITALLITLVYLSYLPNLTEGIYWFIGIANYELGNLLLLLQLSVFTYLVRQKQQVLPLEVFSILLLIVSVGFNEIGAVLIPSGYLFLLLFYPKNQLQKSLLQTHLVVGVISSAFVFFSPGNQTRVNEFPERYQLLHSMMYASLQTARFLAYWILNYPFIVLSLWLVSQTNRFKELPLTRIDYRLLLICLVAIVFTASFIPYFATGSLGQHRTLNYVFPFFLLIWPLFLFSFSHRFNLGNRLSFLHSNFATYVILISSVSVLTATKGSVPIKDLLSNRFGLYKKEFMERQQAIIADPDKPIPALQHIPETFQIVDARVDTSFFANKCMRRFYSETKIVLK